MSRHLTARDRSYRTREDIPEGSRVRLTEDQGWLSAGATGRVLSYSNAGFRGIEAYVELDQAPDGWVERLAELADEDSFWIGHNPRLFSVSAGRLAKP